MTDDNDAAKAERLSARRAKAMPILAVIFISQQASYITGAGNGERTVDHVQIGAWLVLSLVLLLALATGGGWIYSRAVRDLANDEVTKAHRDTAIAFGFFAAMIACFALYVLTLFEPLGGRDAVHAIMSVGIAAALLRFGLLERRAHRDG